jgi:uncharacterized membrane protein YhaH (DUF805 family)
MKRVITWIIINSAYSLILYLALFKGIEGAGNVASFIAWISGIITFLAAISSGVREMARARGRSVPAALSITIGVTWIVSLLWFGWWWTATALVINELFEAAIYNEDEAKP